MKGEILGIIEKTPMKQRRIQEELRLLKRKTIAIFVNRVSAFTFKSFILFYGVLNGKRMTAREVGAVLGCQPKTARKAAGYALKTLRIIDTLDGVLDSPKEERESYLRKIREEDWEREEIRRKRYRDSLR